MKNPLLVMLVACALLGCTTKFEESDARDVQGEDVQDVQGEDTQDVQGEDAIEEDAAGEPDEFDGYDVEVPEVEPAIIIDNLTDGQFIATGTWTEGLPGCCGGVCWGENFLYADIRTPYGDETPNAWADFTPALPEAGLYAVFIWWPEGDDRATQAPVIIQHAEGRTVRILDLTINGSAWHLLGVFRFDAGTFGNVRVEDSRTGYTNADAVGFLQINP